MFIAGLWAFTAAFALHEAEEWNARAWIERNWVGLPSGGTDRAARTWLVFISVVFAAWCAGATIPGDPRLAAWIFLPAVAFAAANGLQHVFWLFYFRQYAPGVITSVVGLIPLGAYLLIRAASGGYVPTLYAAALAVFMFGGLLQAVRDGNRATGPLLALFSFSMRLDNWVWGRRSRTA